MWQRDHVARVTGEGAAPLLPDDVGELVDVGPKTEPVGFTPTGGVELRDRELADGND